MQLPLVKMWGFLTTGVIVNYLFRDSGVPSIKSLILHLFSFKMTILIGKKIIKKREINVGNK